MATGDGLLQSDRRGMRDRLLGLFQSKRAFAIVVAAVLRFFASQGDLDPGTIDLISQAILAWVAGDTLRATGHLWDLLGSTRFWLTSISVGTTVVAPMLGIPVALVAPIVTAISVLVLGKSWREMENKRA